MMRTTRLIIGVLLAAVVGAPVQAQMRSAGPLDRRGISRTADDLFRQVCIEQFGNPAAMQQALRQRGFNPAPPQDVARMQIDDPGQVWRWNDAKQPMLVVTRDTGVPCQLMAPFADVDESAARFRHTMAGLRRPGLTVEAERDEPADLGGQPGRQVFFRVRPPPGTGESRLFALSVAVPRPGGVALTMTASPLPRPRRCRPPADRRGNRRPHRRWPRAVGLRVTADTAKLPPIARSASPTAASWWRSLKSNIRPNQVGSV